LSDIINKGRGEDRTPEDGQKGYNYARERLKGILDREAEGVPQATSHKLDGHSELEQGAEPGPKPSIRERLTTTKSLLKYRGCSKILCLGGAAT
jgi:hypothetical protein